MDYERLKVDKLKELARSLMIEGYEKLKKKELLDKIAEKIGPSVADEGAKKPQENPPSKLPENPSFKLPERLKGVLKESELEVLAQMAWEPQGNFGLSVERFCEIATGEEFDGILDIQPENSFGFVRSAGFFSGDGDIYVSPAQVRRFNLHSGDRIVGGSRVKIGNERYFGLLYIRSVNGHSPLESARRYDFDRMTPIYPDRKLKLEYPGAPLSLRIVDLLSPIGKGQRGMIVSPPKAGKTTIIKQIAKAITAVNPDVHLMVLLIDERPEEVTDITEAIEGRNVQVIASTFDEQPEHHKLMSEKVIERAKGMVEFGDDVVILLDSITRLARAYNLTVTPSGRTLSGGLDPAALYAPKKFFGAARNMRQGGSLTILATALVDTGSRMDDMIFEEFKGTGNMELVLNRKLQEKRVFPAIDIARSGTRNEELLLSQGDLEAVEIIRRALSGAKGEDAAERVIDLFGKSRTNAELTDYIRKTRTL
ncbi:MAG: transcription termination factor Rho [Lachnospiraceae bacterium]|nr:transcription termination factor Rho [Lachnospiraceae bacterium]